MFVYCNNNSVNGRDSNGSRMVFRYEDEEGKDEGSSYRDVTEEVNKALFPYALLGALIQAIELNNRSLFFQAPEVISFQVTISAFKYSYFTSIVNHKAAWDIKRQNSWERTIGTEFPGQNTQVLYEGSLFTPHELGNYTYGKLGKMFGIPLPVLIVGSYSAAGFPTIQSDLENELSDWPQIIRGYAGLG